MDEIRSILYIPAHKDGWVANATTHGADAVILDLEDSVPASEKATARRAITENTTALAEAETTVTLRVNGVDSDWFYDDLALIGSWLDALVIPKVESGTEVQSVEGLLEFVEYQQDITAEIGIIPLLESPTGIYDAYEILTASDRVTGVGSGTSRGGDIQQSLDLGWSAEGFETLYLRSKIVLEARAAGIDQILSGIWATVEDTDGLKEKAQRQKRFGFSGMQAIHPSQIDAINDVFTPNPDDVAYYQEMIEAFEQSQNGDQGVIQFDGEMVDAAKLKQAERVLTRAEEFEIEPAEPQ